MTGKPKKKKPGKSPTQVALKLWRDEGYACQVVEYWNPHAMRRIDLFGFIDIIAMKTGEPIIGIQATSQSNVSARIKKILSLPDHRTWLETGCRIIVTGGSRVVEIEL